MDITLEVPERLGHLPLVMDVLRRTGTLDVIDHAIREDRRSKVSTSECVAVILCAVFVGEHGLWRLRERLSPYDMQTIMQDAGFDLTEFPEERLGKALDDLHAFGLDKLMTAIALQVIEQFRLDTSFLHFDTTTLSFYGAYESEDLWAMMGKVIPPPKVTHGYSKARRPDLKQVLFGSLVTRDHGVPVWGKAMDGNAADSIAAAAFFEEIRKLVADPRDVCCVADCKGWCARVLDVVWSQGMRLLSRLPGNTILHRAIMKRRFVPQERIELPPKTKGQDPDWYEIQGWDETEVIVVPGPDDQDQEIEIPCRAVRVFSSALLRTKQQTLERTREKEQRQAIKRLREWHGRAYACRRDAERALERHRRQHGWTTLDVIGTVEQVDGPMRRRRGRPRKHPEPDLPVNHFRVSYRTKPARRSSIATRLRKQSCFVLIRTRNDGWDFSDEEMVRAYKDQYHVEHGFAWLKSRAAINPMYVELPRRVATLCFLYCIGLMVWNLIQRTVRKYLKEHKLGLPYHRNKPSDRITTRFLFELFPKVQSLVVQLPGGRAEKKILGGDQWTKLACKALGCRADAFKAVGK